MYVWLNKSLGLYPEGIYPRFWFSPQMIFLFHPKINRKEKQTPPQLNKKQKNNNKKPKQKTLHVLRKVPTEKRMKNVVDGKPTI